MADIDFEAEVEDVIDADDIIVSNISFAEGNIEITYADRINFTDDILVLNSITLKINNLETLGYFTDVQMISRTLVKEMIALLRNERGKDNESA